MLSLHATLLSLLYPSWLSSLSLALDSVRNYSCHHLFWSVDAYLVVAAEQIVTEIGHHTSFQDIINNLHSGSSYYISRILFNFYSLAEHDQPNIYQSVIVLVDILPVSLRICGSHTNMLTHVAMMSDSVASWLSLIWHRFWIFFGRRLRPSLFILITCVARADTTSQCFRSDAPWYQRVDTAAGVRVCCLLVRASFWHLLSDADAFTNSANIVS